MTVRTLIFLTAALAALPVHSEEPVESADFEVHASDAVVATDSKDALTRDPEAESLQDRALVTPLPRTTRKGHLLFVIDHRNGEVWDEEAFHNFLGLDGGGLKVGLGLRYGILDLLDAGVYRLNGTAEAWDTWQFDAKARWLNEKCHGIDLAVQGGGTWFSQIEGDDANGFFAGAYVGSSLINPVYVSAGPLFHSNSTAGDKFEEDKDGSLAIIANVTARITDGIALVAETNVPVAGFKSHTLGWGGGIKFITNRHTFAVTGSNTNQMAYDGLAAGTSSDGGDMVLGFSITRELDLAGD